MIDTKQLRDLLAAATPGPWRIGDNSDEVDNGEDCPVCVTHGDHANAALIAAAVNALPELLDEVEQHQALINDATNAIINDATTTIESLKAQITRLKQEIKDQANEHREDMKIAYQEGWHEGHGDEGV